jgi:hypothetical protein
MMRVLPGGILTLMPLDLIPEQEHVDLVARLVVHWPDALDAAEHAVASAEIARSLQPVDVSRFRRHLHEERAWFARLDLAAPQTFATTANYASEIGAGADGRTRAWAHDGVT